MQSSQDYDLWLRIAKRYPVNYIDKPLLNYYVHHNERISTDIDKQIAWRERIILKYIQNLDRNRKTWYLRHRYLPILYMHKGLRKKAFLLFWKCIVKYPWSVLDHSKVLLLIIIGGDSPPYKTYKKAKIYLEKGKSLWIERKM